MEVEDIKRLNMTENTVDTKEAEQQCITILKQITTVLRRLTLDHTKYTVDKLQDILSYIKKI